MSDELRAPDWLRHRGHTFNKTFSVIRSSVSQSSIATVCEEASCPNRTECWSSGTATFMLMGDTCTRGCKFCKIKTSRTPPPINPEEPRLLVDALKNWGEIQYIVLTSVDRDDLDDGGSTHLASCIRKVKEEIPHIKVEILLPDFQGNRDDLKRIIDAGPEVIAHNVETVRRLTPKVRDRRASYDQSLQVLRMAKEINPSIFTKSSIMVGLSENPEEVVETLHDLRNNEVDFVTIGQYMRPSLRQLAVREYVSLEQFEAYQRIAEEIGFSFVVSKPLSRSSYKAGEAFISDLIERRK
ncbi:MAG: lipoyl synthase [Candidatus Heimdallarchaeota archaeon]|nr:lipoyl synthase [Candidatus Heimdallarchaeota archaeon]